MERVAEELRNYSYVNNVGLSEAEISEIAEEFFRENHDFDKEFETGMLDAEFERLIEARFNAEVDAQRDLPFLETDKSKKVREDLKKTIDIREEREFSYADTDAYAEEYASKHSR